MVAAGSGPPAARATRLPPGEKAAPLLIHDKQQSRSCMGQDNPTVYSRKDRSPPLIPPGDGSHEETAATAGGRNGTWKQHPVSLRRASHTRHWPASRSLSTHTAPHWPRHTPSPSLPRESLEPPLPPPNPAAIPAGHLARLLPSKGRQRLPQVSRAGTCPEPELAQSRNLSSTTARSMRPAHTSATRPLHKATRHVCWRRREAHSKLVRVGPRERLI